MLSIYFDVCCLNRPFDDQSQERIRLEAVAVDEILRLVELNEWVSVSSEAVQDEIDGDPSLSRRARVQEHADLARHFVVVEIEQLARAAELQNLGFGPFDALHIACAERAAVDVLLTTDDRMLRLALRVKEKLKVKVTNPITWLLDNPATLHMEVIE